ncbi:MAG: hypothetical protein JWL59_212 [Chthoniobacteraceae bacterium]|nr:hypothetical protein [Chthoniobacteraceae bacterium]
MASYVPSYDEIFHSKENIDPIPPDAGGLESIA